MNVPQSAVASRVYLHPGDLVASATPVEVSTVLGSCVSVFLWDAETGVGGVNHFVLPLGHGPRYGSAAVPELLRRVNALGARRGHLRAHVYGGAGMMGKGPSESTGLGNVRQAISMLAEAHIPITDQHVGGTRGRSLIFSTLDGTVRLRVL
ncbi:MAG TPA: chemotaxis protein CheD [Myxococcales bacterium]|nr:chemotaxis protein CheD [Myxococcales bacterium]